jgi:hypothetical protein
MAHGCYFRAQRIAIVDFTQVVAMRARSQDSTFLKRFSRNTVPPSLHALDLIIKAR